MAVRDIKTESTFINAAYFLVWYLFNPHSVSIDLWKGKRREKEREWEREWEWQRGRERHWSFASHMHSDRELKWQSRYVPLLAIKPITFLLYRMMLQPIRPLNWASHGLSALEEVHISIYKAGQDFKCQGRSLN